MDSKNDDAMTALCCTCRYFGQGKNIDNFIHDDLCSKHMIEVSPIDLCGEYEPDAKETEDD